MDPLKTVRTLPLKTDERPIVLTGLLVLAVSFGVFGTWSVFAELESAAVANGRVTLEGYRKTVQHLEGGIVKEIRVRDGKRVGKGDVLVVLEDTRPRAELEVNRARYFAATAYEARLIAERDRLDVVAYPDDLVEAARTDHRAAEAIKVQTQAFNARRATLLGEAALLGQRVEQLQSKIEGLKALEESMRHLDRSFTDEAGDLRKLFDKGLGDKQRLREVERNAAEARGEAAEHAASVASTDLQISETRQQMLQREKEFVASVVEELKKAQSDVFDLRESLLAAEDTVARTLIRAPESGIVMALQFHTIGGVIKPGTPILDIVPEDVPLVVEAQVNPIDIDKVRPGLPADVRFSAFSARYTPVIEGNVTTVSADRVEAQDGKSSYYLAHIEVSDEGRERLGELTLYPGMPAEVMIRTGGRSLLSYLVQPMTDAFARAFRED